MQTLKTESPMSWLASQPSEDWHQFLRSLSPREKMALEYRWRGWKARPNQLAPEGDWRTWLILAGRGFGKTRSGAEWVREQVEGGSARRIALVAETESEAREVMIEGESGILAISPPDFRPQYEPSKRRLSWPNGAVATAYSGDEPDQLRGPQHDAAWADELAKWKNATEAWDNLELGLRVGPHPRVVATTTPRPIKLLRQLLADPMTVVTLGSTYDNIAHLSPSFIDRVIRRYEGTRWGRQELHAELLEDVPGGLWQRERIESLRCSHPPEFRRIVVAIDPAVSASEDCDETGIVAVGVGIDNHGYVLADVSCRMPPHGWARRAVELYNQLRADRILAEVNNGGDLVESTLRVVEERIPFRAVRASHGKAVRAEPVAALYEQGRVHHVGSFDLLEDQLCLFTTDGYVGSGSPDRADALVWAVTELMVNQRPEPGIFQWYREEAEKLRKQSPGMQGRGPNPWDAFGAPFR
jgi:phage terminase large subunit-like protein